ncbi:MAG: Rnase Y domain-containing protein, partial [Oscillospiraceae bacterium]
MILAGIIGFVIGGVIAFVLGVNYRKKIAEAELGSAEQEATRLLNDAIKTAENK